jgi:hypothetical protein
VKLLPVILTSSLLANAILAAVVVLRWQGAEVIATGSDKRVERPVAGGYARQATRGAEERASEWADSTQPEVGTLVSRLRADGFPPELVRAIVHAEVRQQFRSRYQTVADAAARQPYWRGSRYSLGADPTLERARRTLDREVAESVASVLGSSATPLSESELRGLRRQYGDLDAARATELQRIHADYADLMNEIRGESRGLLLPEDAAALAMLERERRADIQNLLTPEELEQVELRTSPTAQQLRAQLSAFHPTEDEFRALFRLQQGVDSRFAPNSSLSPEQRRLRAEAQTQLAAQLQATLGAERYAEYQRTTDPAWRTANQFVTQLGLPSTVTGELLAVQRDVTQRMAGIHANAELTPEQRRQQLAALAEAARKRLSSSLGERGLAAYQQNQGYWLQALQRTTATPASP